VPLCVAEPILYFIVGKVLAAWTCRNRQRVFIARTMQTRQHCENYAFAWVRSGGENLGFVKKVLKGKRSHYGKSDSTIYF
jgi:hypothetical protein